MNFPVGQFGGDAVGLRVDHDAVAVAQQAEQAAILGFGGDVAHHETVRTPAETAVGDERYFFAQARPHDGRGGLEHFGHPRSTARAAVADHHHVTRLDGARADGGIGVVLAVENAGRTAEVQAFLTGDLSHRATLGQVAVEDTQVPGRFDGIGEGTDDRLSGREIGHVQQVFGQCAAGHRQAIAV